jgi:hypothetical protein
MKKPEVENLVTLSLSEVYLKYCGIRFQQQICGERIPFAEIFGKAS